jgi:hypothetical protein
MITIATTIVGAALGATTALRRGGKAVDALQYATGYAIAFALLGMLVTILVDRNLIG